MCLCARVSYCGILDIVKRKDTTACVFREKKEPTRFDTVVGDNIVLSPVYLSCRWMIEGNEASVDTGKPVHSAADINEYVVTHTLINECVSA